MIVMNSSNYKYYCNLDFYILGIQQFVPSKVIWRQSHSTTYHLCRRYWVEAIL